MFDFLYRTDEDEQLFHAITDDDYDTLINKTFLISYEQHIYDLTIVPSSNEYMIIGGWFDGITPEASIFL